MKKILAFALTAAIAFAAFSLPAEARVVTDKELDKLAADNKMSRADLDALVSVLAGATSDASGDATFLGLVSKHCDPGQGRAYRVADANRTTTGCWWRGRDSTPYVQWEGESSPRRVSTKIDWFHDVNYNPALD